MTRLSQATVDRSGVHRPGRTVAALALGLILFSTGLRAFRARPFPSVERANGSGVESTKTHTKGCGLCVTPPPQLAVDPRAPTLAPPDEHVASLGKSVSIVAASRPDADRPIRAPPAS
jgi:hypothetical protein